MAECIEQHFDKGELVIVPLDPQIGQPQRLCMVVLDKTHNHNNSPSRKRVGQGEPGRFCAKRCCQCLTPSERGQGPRHARYTNTTRKVRLQQEVQGQNYG